MITKKSHITINVNGRDYHLKEDRDYVPSDSLAKVLRETLGLVGVRVSCEQGACGACTVLFDGRSVLSCMMLVEEADGHRITTIEAFDGSDYEVDAFVNTCGPGEGTAMQCGYCTPGFIMEAHSLLDNDSNPTDEEITEALSGHICRCGCYHGIHASVRHASEHLCQCEGGAEK